MNHRPFREMTNGLSKARKARVAVRRSKLKTEMALHEQCQARERSQTSQLLRARGGMRWTRRRRKAGDAGFLPSLKLDSQSLLPERAAFKPNP
jgi:hypothetical protein